MRTGFVRRLENGNWYVVERVGRKLEVLLDDKPTEAMEAMDSNSAASLAANDALEMPSEGRSGVIHLGEKQQKHGCDWWPWTLEEP